MILFLNSSANSFNEVEDGGLNDLTTEDDDPALYWPKRRTDEGRVVLKYICIRCSSLFSQCVLYICICIYIRCILCVHCMYLLNIIKYYFRCV